MPVLLRTIVNTFLLGYYKGVNNPLQLNRKHATLARWCYAHTHTPLQTEGTQFIGSPITVRGVPELHRVAHKACGEVH